MPVTEPGRAGCQPAVYFLKTPKNKYSIRSLVGVVDDLAVRVISPAELPAVERGLLLISFMTFEKERYRDLVAAVRRRRRPVIIVAGGPHATGAPVEVMDMGTDAVCIGEGEGCIRAIIDDYCRGRMRRHYEGAPVDLNLFRPYSAVHKMFGPIEVTRGCRHRCSYCQVPSLFHHQVRHRTVDNVAQACAVMMARDIIDLRMITPDAFGFGRQGSEDNTGVIEDLLRTLRTECGRRAKIYFGSFPSEIRPDSVTVDKIKLLKEYTDTRQVVLGMQSASPVMLDRISREHSPDSVREACRGLIRYGFSAVVDIIFGLPGETAADRRATMNFCDDLIVSGVRIHGHYFMPLPGTRLAAQRPVDLEPDVFAWFSRHALKRRAFGSLQAQYRFVNRNAVNGQETAGICR